MQPFDDHELCNIGERNQHTQKGGFDITKEISLYPNPTTGHVYWTREQDGPVTVKVFNSLVPRPAMRMGGTGGLSELNNSATNII
jgi:hypothetical protein